MSDEKKSQSGKTRITIRLDNQVLDWFKQLAEENDGLNYQTLINEALLKHIENKSYSTIEETIRQTIREELAMYKPTAEPESTDLPQGSDINDLLPDSNPFKGIVGIFHGGPGDSSTKVKEILTAEVNSISGFGFDK